MNKAIILSLMMLSACEGESRRTYVEDQVNDEEYMPGTFQVTPHCPAPSHPHAESYVQSGGSQSAINWLLMMHAINTLSGPSHVREVHHVYERPVYRPYRPVAPVVRPRSFPVAVTKQTPGASASKPSSSSVTTYTKQTRQPSNNYSLTTSSKSSTGVVRKSPSYGYKPRTRK
jgi:hypothetical protein